MVERGPEKAGVGGSIPSLATIFIYFINPKLAGGTAELYQFCTASRVNLLAWRFGPMLTSTPPSVGGDHADNTFNGGAAQMGWGRSVQWIERP